MNPMMKKLLLSLLITFCYSVAFLSCQKELNFQDVITKTPGTNGGTAKYSFSQTNGTCSAAIIKGTYNKATALNSLNSVEIRVKVDSVGTYSIATANVNGILFGGTGTFTTTGEQTITLVGFGTPLSSGTFIYIPGSQGCSFSITFSANPMNDGIALFTLNGTPDSCATPIITGDYITGISLDSTCLVTIKATVTTPGSYSIASNAVNGIIFIGSGTFTTSGQQTIILQGSGRPIEAGNFTFTPGTNGCTFTITCTIN